MWVHMGTKHIIDRIVNHPHFNPNWLLNDVSLLRTSEIIRFNRGIVAPAQLPAADFQDGQRVLLLVPGWGLTDVSKLYKIILILFNMYAFLFMVHCTRLILIFQYPNSGVQHVPQYLQVQDARTIPHHYCRVRLGEIVQNDKMCTQTPYGQGNCLGDTGGPLTNRQGLFIGIVTFGLSCGVSRPDLYTRTFPHLQFIRNTAR